MLCKASQQALLPKQWSLKAVFLVTRDSEMKWFWYHQPTRGTGTNHKDSEQQLGVGLTTATPVLSYDSIRFEAYSKGMRVEARVLVLLMLKWPVMGS